MCRPLKFRSQPLPRTDPIFTHLMNTPPPLSLPVKAVICAVYGTLLERGPAPADADTRWTQLWRTNFKRPPRLSLADFNSAADRALQADATLASARGVDVPAPYWPAVAAPLLPELRDLPPDDAAGFLYTHAQLRRSVRLMPGADTVLRELNQRGILLGLISNGHPHSPVELALALHAPCAPIESFIPPVAAHGVFHGADTARELEIFTPPLCFWSFSHGFGKPNLHVFQHVSTRLRVRRIDAHEVLMVGENEAGDLQPAKKFRWRTWLLAADAAGRVNAGDWPTLAQTLGLAAPK